MALPVDEGRLGLADDDEPAVTCREDLDRCAVQPGQRLTGDDLSGRSRDGGAACEVHDVVDVAEDRVDVMRDEQDGDPLGAADLLDERGDGALVRQVEAVERLVQEEELRSPNERLRDEESLLLAAGERAERTFRVALGSDERDRLAHPLCGRVGADSRQRHAPAVAVEPEANEIDAADPRRRVEASSLRQVADRGVRRTWCTAEHAHTPARQRQQAERHPEQRRLSRAVRSEHGDECARIDRQGDVGPDDLPAETHFGLRGLEGRAHPAVDRVSAAASCRNWRSCHDWNVEVGGVSVSVMVVTGIPRRRAAAVSRWTSGVLFWLL